MDDAQKIHGGGQGGVVAPPAAEAKVFFFSFFFLFRSERFGACQVRARLIADVRDVGEGVLTGARVGEVKILFVVIFVFEKKKKKKKKKKNQFAEILQSDWDKKGDWVWGTVGTRAGWLPRNHLQ
jgi:hypothetical protein